MLSHILLPNLSRLSNACAQWKQPNRPCLNRVATIWRAVLKAPLAVLMAGVLANLGCSFIAHAGPVTDWNTIVTDHVAANQDPATQTHTLAIVHIAMHDALNAVDPRYEPYAYTGSAPEASVAAAVARNTLLLLVPEAAATIDAEYAAALAALPNGLAKEAGVLTGQAAAAAILDLRSPDDLIAATTKPYTLRHPAPGVYQPTPPLNFVLAGWGELTPFAPSSRSRFRSAPPFRVNSYKYAKDYKEVKRLGSLDSATRSERQTETARFWYDVGTKEWHRAAQTGLSHVSADEWRAARLLALLSIAMADGVVASFETKFDENFWRPITAIRAGDDDGNASTQGDPNWEPLCVTPPFPEHNSTHAVVAAAAATTLARELGDRHTFTVESPIGVSRTYTRFSRAAHEEAISRIYCGIHFRNGMNAGLAQGAAVAHHTFENLLRPLDGDCHLPSRPVHEEDF